jgi:hypothetical protein
MKILPFVLGLVLLNFSSFGAVFEDPQMGLSFQYDESLWEPNREKVSGSEVLFSLQRKVADKEGDTVYFSRVSIVKETLSNIKNLKISKLSPLQAYQVRAVEFLKSQRFNILTSESKNNESVPGGFFEIGANQRDFGLTFQQMGFVTKDSGVLVTATVRTSKFPEYKEELSKMFQSVKISPKL